MAEVNASDFLVGIVFSSGFLGVLYLIERISQRSGHQKEATRKLAHILGGFFALWMGFLLHPMVFTVLILVFAAIMVWSYRRKFFSSIHGVDRLTYGEVFLPLGILTAYLLSGGPTQAFVAVMLILTLCDPLASVVGKWIPSDRKTKLGSLAFLVASTAILFAVFGLENNTALVATAALVTAAERFSPYGTDNLTIPLTGGLLLYFLL